MSNQRPAGSIDDLLARGGTGNGYRSRARAKDYLPSFRTALNLSPASDPVLDYPMEEFLIEAVLGAAWYTQRYSGAKQRVGWYIALNAGLVVALPLALIGLGALPGVSGAKAIGAQATAVLTGVLALQKTLAGWYATQQRYAAWYKSASDLKSIYYALIQTWQGKAAADPVAFVVALDDATTAARKVISDEQLDFYQKLALPSFDILDMVTGARSTVSSFVTSILPGSPQSTLSVVGKNLVLSTPPASGPPAVQTISGQTSLAQRGGIVTAPQVQVRAVGAAKPNPYTIVIVANPAVETPADSQYFQPDPILSNPAQFEACVQYVMASVFGKLAGQAETFMAQFEPQVRVISIFDPTVTVGASSALAATYGDVIGPRQPQFASFLAGYQSGGQPIKADVSFAVTAFGTDLRSASLFTYDDDNSGGVPFSFEGQQLFHRYENLQPGAVALHVSADSVVALHEFGHAASSWTNGSVTDLYVDSNLDNNPVNIRVGRPIPSTFATYENRPFASDPLRDSLRYPADWQSYHCALVDTSRPAIMDDFWLAKSGGPQSCRHDQITVTFLTDRIRAIMSRP
jgi:hypothetical protein